MPYGFYITDKGRELIDSAIPSESKVKITKACFGSGGNPEAERNYGITDVVNQVYEKNLDPQTDEYKVNPDDPYSLYLKVIVPSEVSGTINEIGYKDESGNLIFYGIVQERTKVGGALGKGIVFQYEHWIRLENGDVDKIEVYIKTPEYGRVEELVDSATKEFTEKLESTTQEFTEKLEEADRQFSSKLEETDTRLTELLEQAEYDFNLESYVQKAEVNEMEQADVERVFELQGGGGGGYPDDWIEATEPDIDALFA